jgi:hypothetical protein
MLQPGAVRARLPPPEASMGHPMITRMKPPPTAPGHRGHRMHIRKRTKT